MEFVVLFLVMKVFAHDYCPKKEEELVHEENFLSLLYFHLACTLVPHLSSIRHEVIKSGMNSSSSSDTIVRMVVCVMALTLRIFNVVM